MLCLVCAKIKNFLNVLLLLINYKGEKMTVFIKKKEFKKVVLLHLTGILDSS